MTPTYERGQVYWTTLDPTQGHEQAKTRPCAILSDTLINQRRGTVVVVPLTTTAAPERFPLLVAMPSMGEHTKARTEHIRSVDKSRLGRLVGALGSQDLDVLGRAIGKVLKLM